MNKQTFVIDFCKQIGFPLEFVGINHGPYNKKFTIWMEILDNEDVTFNHLKLLSEKFKTREIDFGCSGEYSDRVLILTISNAVFPQNLK